MVYKKLADTVRSFARVLRRRSSTPDPLVVAALCRDVMVARRELASASLSGMRLHRARFHLVCAELAHGDTGLRSSTVSMTRWIDWALPWPQ